MAPTERRCQTGQLTCLGQKPDSSCGLCYYHSCLGQRPDITCDPCHNHFRSCPRDRRLISWCKGEVCKYDMGRSSNTRVTREETTDEATDVSLEHWGRGAELIGDKAAGSEQHVEAPEYDTEGEYDTDTEGEYDTDTEYDTDIGDSHNARNEAAGYTSRTEVATSDGSTAKDSRNKVKPPKPSIDQTQLLEASLETGHKEGCWDWQVCRYESEVCRYDLEGEYDTDTDTVDNHNASLEASLDTGHKEGCWDW